MNRKQSILLVEDERELALMMAAVLESHGFLVRTCFTGEEALLEYKPGGVDLLITDLKMPGISGFELILKVREFNAGQRILVTTGVRPTGNAQPFQLATLSFISKPFSAGKLLETVSEAIAECSIKKTFPKTMVRKDLISLCSLNGSSFVFEFRSKCDKGSIYLQKGVLVHAQTQMKQGKEAFYDMLSWENGGVLIVPLRNEFRQATISESLDTLLKKITTS